MRTVKGVRYALFCIAILICEMTFGSYIEVSGAVPMLGFCFCVTMALFENDTDFVIGVSAALGSVLDILTGHGFGTYTFSFAACALITYYIRDRIFSSKVLLLICDVFILSLVVNALYYLFHIKDIGIDFAGLFSSIILPSAIYNIAVSLVLYPIIKRILCKRR